MNMQYLEPHLIIRRNNEAPFDPLIEMRLKCYVYSLINPLNGKVFYIGKGGGKGDGDGNQRVLNHFNEAEDWLRRGCLSVPSQKIKTILDIWFQGQAVQWFILRHGLDEEMAHHIESALIDILSLTTNGATDNLVRGHGVHTHGLLSKEDVFALAAEPVNPSKPFGQVFVFQVHNQLALGKNLYDATRGSWKVNPKWQQLLPNEPVYAVGVSKGISRAVYEVREWERDEATNLYRFTGTAADIDELLNKSFVNIMAPSQGYLQRGGGYLIVDFDGQGSFNILKGYGDKQRAHPCT